jgi:homoserine kinase
MIESEIPPERGLGSSAAVIVGLLWSADKITESSDPISLHGTPQAVRTTPQAATLHLDRNLIARASRVLPGSAGGSPAQGEIISPDLSLNDLLTHATAIDGHPDNVAASLLGGFTVATITQNKKILAQKLPWPKQWCPILVVPPYPLATSKARRSLPKTVSHTDADFNVQHVAALLAAVQTENEELLKEALHDRLHEDYRAELVPELNQLKKELQDSPALGCVLSGAGSSVLVLVNKNKKPEILKQIKNWQKQESPNSTLLDLKVDHKGLQELH